LYQQRSEIAVSFFADVQLWFAHPRVPAPGAQPNKAPHIPAAAESVRITIGKKPIHVRKEVVGHVANRLQAALYREIVYLIEQGVLDVADSVKPGFSTSWSNSPAR
jgi:hypothetical protein